MSVHFTYWCPFFGATPHRRAHLIEFTPREVAEEFGALFERLLRFHPPTGLWVWLGDSRQTDAEVIVARFVADAAAAFAQPQPPAEDVRRIRDLIVLHPDMRMASHPDWLTEGEVGIVAGEHAAGAMQRCRECRNGTREVGGRTYFDRISLNAFLADEWEEAA